ncbi:MAG: aminotransferase class I/II-fold pyridoxal phosphate-dependent enzyme [Acidimicrobiales bacterium]
MTPSSATAIAATIEREIIDGTRRAGDQLTPVRALASELRVSPTTIAAAYRRLRERGLVIGHGRQGTIVAPRSSPTAQGTATAPPGTIDALTGNPDPSLLPDLRDALIGHLELPMRSYGHALVDPAFHDIATTDFSADGINPTHVTVTNGSMDAIARILDAQDFRAGDRIAVEDPGHVPVFQLARTKGLVPVPFAVDQHGPVAHSFEAALASGVRAVVITPRAQNPTGAALTPDRAEALRRTLASHPQVMLIVDDHAGPISGAPYADHRARHPEPPDGQITWSQLPRQLWLATNSIGRAATAADGPAG